MKDRTPLAVIYARVSTARQADDGLPVESQLAQCRAKAQALGAKVLEVFRDDGISGRTSKRPGFQAALDYCDDHRVDYFVCWSSSRFARNHIDAALNKRILEKSGAKLVFVSQDFGESDEAWMIESIVAIMDEQYSRSIAKDTRRSMAKNAEDGFWNGGNSPFGYAPVPMGKRKKLAPVESEAIVVRTIFRWSIDGLGQKEIALRLNETGVGRRGKRWDKASVASILKSRAVIGQIVFMDRGREIVTQAHEAILSEEVFAMAQVRKIERSPRIIGGRTRSEAAFSGLLICGKCGEAMYTESSTGRAGVRYHYYNCRSFLKGMGCESGRMRVDWLDEILLDGIATRIFTAENIAGILLDMKIQTGEWARDKQAKIDAMADELADVEKRLRRLYETIEAGAGLALSDISPRIRELRTRQDALKIEIERVDADPGPQVSLANGETEAAARIFRDVLLTAENPAKVREFLGHVIQKVVIQDGFASLEYLPERIVNARLGDSQCEVRWLPDLGSNQGPTD
jgi:site-specific DNA recombinase